MKRTFLQFGSAFLFSLGATAPLSANNPWYVHCEKGCTSCTGGQGNCQPSTETHTTVSTYEATDPLAKENAEAEAARLVAAGQNCVASDRPLMQKATSGSGGSGGIQSMSTFTDRGVSADTYDRKNVIFQGLGMGAVKYEEDPVTHEKRPKQVPLLHHVLVYTDLAPAGSGYKKAQYLRSQLGNPDANGLYTIPSNVQPLATTTYRNPEPGTPASGKLDVVHEQRHPQGTGMVTHTIRYDSPLGGSTWSRKYYLGDPVANGTLQTYREVTVERSSNPDNSENNRETTKDRDSAGNLVITSDVSQIMGFYKYGSPVVLSATKHTGLGSSSELTSTWTYYHDAADQASFNKPATLRRNDGQWANYTYQGSLVTGVLVTKTVSGWLDNAAPAVEVAPDENANRVVTEIEARGETGTFGREEKVQGVLVSKSWGERYKDNSGLLVEKNRVETGTSTLLTIRTGYADDESASVAERGRLKSVENPDGTVEVYRYQLQGTNLVETAEKGAGTTSGVTSGTRTISTYTSDDVLIKEIKVDIASGLELSAKEAIAFDSNQQPTRWAYNNDPADYSETIYGCCGIDSTRSRDGIVTTYTRDALKRPLTEVSLGITTTYTYGGKSIGGVSCPTVASVKTAGGLTQLLGTVVTDHAGNVVERVSPDLDGDSNEEVTEIVRNVASRTKTSTNPDGGTTIEIDYADGQSKSRSGTAVAPSEWTYGMHSEQGGGLVTTSYAGNSSSTRWTKSYQNLAGDTLKTTAPGGSGEVAIQINAFDAAGRITAISDGDGVATIYAYNAEGERYRTALDLNQNGQIDNADRVTDTLEDVVTESPIGAARRIRQIIYDLSNQPVTTSTTLQSVSGLLNRTEVLGGGVTTSEAEPWTDRVDGVWNTTATLADGTKSVTTYTGRQATGQFSLDTTNNPIDSTTAGYDALNRVVTQNDSRKTTVTARIAYDGAGQIISVTEDLTTGADRVTSFAYDSVGRRIVTTLPDSTVKHVSYWPTGQVKAEWGSQTYPTVKLYSPQGELVELRNWRSSAPATPDETSTGFDKTTWSYNDRGQMNAKLYADNKGPSYTYTAGGRLHTRTWARGVVTTYGYNAAGELTTTDYSDSTPDVAIAFDKLGRKTSVSNGVAQSVFVYDAATLRLDMETVSYNVDGSPGFEFVRVLDRSNDSLGRDTGWQLKNGTTIENEAAYGYHEATGRLATVAGIGGTFTYGYVPGSSLIASMAGPAHTVTNTWFPDRDVLQLKENKVGATVVSSFDYGVNAIGQRSGVAQTGSAFASTCNIAWGYDVLGQVVSADSSETGHDRSYLYDTIGNRKKSADNLTLPSSDNYTVNMLNQYTAVAAITPSYDDDGNATAYPVPADPSVNSNLVWDGENRMIESTVQGVTTSYVYDAQSRRIAKITGSSINLELYDGWNCIARYEGGLLTKGYLWGLDLSGSVQRAGGVGGLLAVGEGTVAHFPSYDGNGNVSEYLTSTGTVSAHFEYDPFGGTVVNTDTSGLFDVRFSTKQQDVATGLYYYGYRYYDPVTGRWPSRDPLGERGGMNLYGFVYNEPLSQIDLCGLTSVSVILDNFFSLRPFGRRALWVMPEKDSYTSIVRKWEPVISEVENIKAAVAADPLTWKKDHSTSQGWAPGWNEIGDPREGYFSDVDSPPGTDPNTARNEFIKYLIFEIATDKLHTSAIGSFRMHATVDDVDMSNCTATINIWMSNTMDRASFGQFADHPLVAFSSMETQHMWWNWKEKIVFDGSGNYTAPAGGGGGWGNGGW